MIKKFIEHGLLDEITGRTRNRCFRYSDYVGLFGEE